MTVTPLLKAWLGLSLVGVPFVPSASADRMMSSLGKAMTPPPNEESGTLLAVIGKLNAPFSN
jgi:hypothetical protein